MHKYRPELRNVKLQKTESSLFFNHICRRKLENGFEFKSDPACNFRFAGLYFPKDSNYNGSDL